MKKIICICLSVLMITNSLLTIFATSTSSDLVVSVKGNTINNNDDLNSESGKIIDEIMVLNYIGMKIEEILRTESTIVLTDTIDMIQKGGLQMTKISDEETRDYCKTLFDSATEWKINDMERNRIQFQYDQRDARAMNEALKPNVMALLTTAVASSVTKDPLTAVLSIGSLVADSVSSYYGSLEQSENDYSEGNFKLDVDQLKTIDGIKKNFFEYTAKKVDKLKSDNSNIESNLLYLNVAENYSTNLLEKNIDIRLKTFLKDEDVFKVYPAVYLEIAKCYFEKEDYKKCVEYVDKYIESDITIFNCDEDFASVYPLAFAAASNYMSNSDYEKYAIKNLNNVSVLETNMKKGDLKNRLPIFKYRIALVYMDLYKKTSKKEYLEKAYDIVYQNVLDLKKDQDKLREYEINENLILNLEVLKGLVEKLNKSSTEKNEINKILFGNNYTIFDNLPLSEHYYYGNYLQEMIDYVNDNQQLYIYCDPVESEDYTYCSVFIPSAIITEDAEVRLSFKDSAGKMINEDLSFFDNIEDYCAYYITDYDQVINFNDITNVKVNINPKKGINCRELSFDIGCIKMPFGKEENDGYTVDEMKEQLVELGFDENNITINKDKDLFEKDDGKVKLVAYSNYTDLYWDKKEKKYNTERCYIWHKGAVLSKNQKIYIEYR